MGNKILTLNGDSQKSSKKEVYVDLDMTSVPTNYEVIDDDESTYLAYLITEQKYDEAIGYIVSDESSEELKARFQIIFNVTNKIKRIQALKDWLEKSKYRIAKSVNVKAIMNSLTNIFYWIPGQRIINPEFGSKLQYYLYEGITSENIEKIMSEIRHSVSKWEPRVSIVKVLDVSTIDDTEDNIVRLDIVFTIPSLSEEQYTYSYIYNKGE